MVSYDKAVYTEPKVSMKVLPCHHRMAPFFSSLSKARDKIYFSTFSTDPRLCVCRPLPASICTALGLDKSPPAAPGPRKHPHFQPQ